MVVLDALNHRQVVSVDLMRTGRPSLPLYMGHWDGACPDVVVGEVIELVEANLIAQTRKLSPNRPDQLRF
jgi:hypothetical protein